MVNTWASYIHIKKTNGFTLVELAIVIVVIGILATVVVAGWSGLRQRAATTAMLTDLSEASAVVENYALNNNGSFPDTDFLLANIGSSKGVTISIIVDVEAEEINELTPEPTIPHYINLSPIQNSVLFHTVCNEVHEDGFGVGTNIDGGTEPWIQWCHPQYGPNQWQLQGWGGQSANTYSAPVTDEFMQDKINNISYSDNYRPDRTTVERAFWQEFYDRFIAIGGTFPVTTFWNPNYGCNQWSCWNLPAYEPLPELPEAPESGGGSETTTSGGASIAGLQRYCILATHSKYPEIFYSFSSNVLASKQGNCGESVAE